MNCEEAQSIADTFVDVFYRHLHEGSDSLASLYDKNACIFVRGDKEDENGSETVLEATGKADIVSLYFNRLALRGCAVHIDVLEAQPSLSRSVLLLVSGLIWANGDRSGCRRFSHVFVLQKELQRFVIHNDVLHLMERLDGDNGKRLIERQQTSQTGSPNTICTPSEKPLDKNVDECGGTDTTSQGQEGVIGKKEDSVPMLLPEWEVSTKRETRQWNKVNKDGIASSNTLIKGETAPPSSKVSPGSGVATELAGPSSGQVSPVAGRFVNDQSNQIRRKKNPVSESYAAYFTARSQESNQREIID